MSMPTMALRPVDGSEWAVMRDQATVLVRTGFLPEAIKTPEQAVAIMLKGREIAIPPMYALANIVVIKGKPTCSAELMLALIYRDHGDEAAEFPESTAKRCTISYKRKAWTKRLSYSFTLEDAQTAGLVQKGTWSQFPAAMLRARCISAVARMAFPDSIGGMYTPEELGAAVAVNDQGEINIVPEPAPSATNPTTTTGAVARSGALPERASGELVDLAREFADEIDPATAEPLAREAVEDRIISMDWLKSFCRNNRAVKVSDLSDTAKRTLVTEITRERRQKEAAAATPTEPGQLVTTEQEARQ